MGEWQAGDARRWKPSRIKYKLYINSRGEEVGRGAHKPTPRETSSSGPSSSAPPTTHDKACISLSYLHGAEKVKVRHDADATQSLLVLLFALLSDPSRRAQHTHYYKERDGEVSARRRSKTTNQTRGHKAGQLLERESNLWEACGGTRELGRVSVVVQCMWRLNTAL